MSFHFELPGGVKLRLPTAGTYCDRDMVLTGAGHTDADLQTKFDEGLAQGVAACTAKHFSCALKGTGTGSASFYVPFRPDLVLIVGFDPTYGVQQCNVLALFLADLGAFGLCGGYCAYSSDTGSTKSTLYSSTSVLNRCHCAENGIITVQNLINSTSVFFDATYTYTAIAVKYTDQTDRERITDYVNSLTGSGTATFNQAKVNAAFTDNEWAALIATKPGWTFTWI